MADLRILGTIFIIFGCTFDISHGTTSPPAQTNICLSETIRGYTWNDTVSGITASQSCQSPYNGGQIFRTCTDGTWSEPQYSTCRTVAIADRDTIYLIQYVCCGTTILCVLLTLFILVFAWRNAGAETTILEISFGLAIIASNVAFLAGVNNTSDKLMCKITAVCLHYLPTVTVFHLFSIIFHLSTLRFQTSKHSYCCLLFTAWGVPALIIGLYGYFTRLEEYGNSENCWVLFSTRLFWVYYGTLMSICGFTFICLFGIIYRTKLPGRGPKLGSVIGAVPVCIVFITTIMTWVTGVISVNEYNDGLYITQIVFGTFDFIQGLVYLVVFGVLGSRARKEKAADEEYYCPQASWKSETRLSRVSMQPTVSTYIGYHDDHVRDWSYNRHLYRTQRPPVMEQQQVMERQQVTDFYSTDEEVQQRYMEDRRRENHRVGERTPQMSTLEGSQGNLSSFQVDNTPERPGNTVVVVHKEVVFAPDRILPVDQSGANDNTTTDDEGITFTATEIEQQQKDLNTNSPAPHEFHQAYDDEITAETSAVFQSQPPSDDRMESKDNETRINAAADIDNDDSDDEGTQPSSPVTQRLRNFIDPPAPSRISATEIDTFTIDVPEERVTKNESDEFILQDEGEVVMEYRNDHFPTTEEDASHEHPFQSPSEPATAALDDTESHTGSVIVYHEEEGNTLLHITNGIAMGNGQADEDDEYVDARSAPLITGTEERPESSYPSNVNMQQESQPADASIYSFRSQLKTSQYNDGDKPKSKLIPSSSFLSRLRRKLRPVSTKPNLKDFPLEPVVHQEPEPGQNPPQNQSKDHKGEGSQRRQMEIPDDALLPPPPFTPETHEPEDRPSTPPPNNPPSAFVPPSLEPRPPTPPPPFVPSSNVVPPPPPPPMPQSSPYPKQVSFANNDVEISSHL